MKFKYIKISNSYIDYLKQHESRIPNYDYGEGHYKPFFVCLEFKEADIVYASQITSVKPRHINMSNQNDFIKIYKNKTLIGAINLNYMFPVLKNDIIEVNLEEMQKYLNHPNAVDHLNTIAEQVNMRDVLNKSIIVYRNKINNSDNALSKRSLDFKQLEAKLIQYELENRLQQEIEVNHVSNRYYEVKSSGYETIATTKIFQNFEESIEQLTQTIKEESRANELVNKVELDDQIDLDEQEQLEL